MSELASVCVSPVGFVVVLVVCGLLVLGLVLLCFRRWCCFGFSICFVLFHCCCWICFVLFVCLFVYLFVCYCCFGWFFVCFWFVCFSFCFVFFLFFLLGFFFFFFGGGGVFSFSLLFSFLPGFDWFAVALLGRWRACSRGLESKYPRCVFIYRWLNCRAPSLATARCFRRFHRWCGGGRRVWCTGPQLCVETATRWPLRRPRTIAVVKQKTTPTTSKIPACDEDLPIHSSSPTFSATPPPPPPRHLFWQPRIKSGSKTENKHPASSLENLDPKARGAKDR